MIDKTLLDSATAGNITHLAVDSDYAKWIGSMLPIQCGITNIELKAIEDDTGVLQEYISHVSEMIIVTPNGAFWCEAFITRPPYKCKTPRFLKRLCKKYMRLNKHVTWDAAVKNPIKFFNGATHEDKRATK